MPLSFDKSLTLHEINLRSNGSIAVTKGKVALKRQYKCLKTHMPCAPIIIFYNPFF